MKLTIEGTSEEIKKALQAISGSEERGEEILKLLQPGEPATIVYGSSNNDKKSR